MKKEVYTKDLNDIKGFLSKVKTLNESIQFGDNEEDYSQFDDFGNTPDEVADGEQDMSKMPPMEDEKSAEDQGMANLDDMGELDQIREITLKGMIKLCKNPEDATYQALKKIFQMCDKAVTEKDNNQEMQSR